MKRTILAALVAVVLCLPLAAADQTKWTIDASGFYLTRSAGSNSPLVSTYSNPGTGDIMVIKDVALTAWKPGADLRIAYSLCRKWGVEVRGSLLAKASKSFTNTNSSGSFISYAIETTPVTSYGMPTEGSMEGTNNAEALKNVEANATFALTPSVSLYGGFRFIQFNDSFTLLGVFPAQEDTETDIWTAKNNMWGVQIGARADILSLLGKSSGKFSVDGSLGAALFLNKAKSDFYLDNSLASALADNKLSPAVDAGLRFGYRLNDMFEVHAGYNLLWIGSVAQSVRMIANMNTYFGDRTMAFDSLLYHGAKAGVTVRF